MSEPESGRALRDGLSQAEPASGLDPSGFDPSREVKIAVVQALDGHLTCCGPDDFRPQDSADAMHAAIGWHLGAGHLPAGFYWITAQLPPLPSIPELRAKADEGQFPKSFLDEIIEGDAPQPDLSPVELPPDFGRV